MSGLPDGWSEAPLGELSDVIRGVTFPASAKQPGKASGNVCCLRTTNIQREVDWTSVYFLPRDLVKRHDQLVQVGDILMSMANSYELVGKVAVVRELPHEAAFGAFLSAIRPTGAASSQYLFHFLRTTFAQQALRQGSNQTTNIANIGTRELGKIPVPVAPLPEQKRIADKLDALLARVDACRERLDRVPGILKRFRQAVLAAATSGELTREWREARGVAGKQLTAVPGDNPWPIPAGWQWATAESACHFITKGTTPPGDRMVGGSGEVPYIKVYNLTFDGRLDFSTGPTFVDRTTHRFDLKRSIVLPGDVLLNIVGPPLGKVAVVPNTYPEWNINQAIARFRPRPSVTSGFLALCMMDHRTIYGAARQAKATAGQFNLTLEICRAIPLPLPPLDEQAEVTRRVDALFRLAERIDRKREQAKDHISELPPAILAKAFRGELVPQDPTDEPAAELLARIRAARVPRATR